MPQEVEILDKLNIGELSMKTEDKQLEEATAEFAKVIVDQQIPKQESIETEVEKESTKIVPKTEVKKKDSKILSKDSSKIPKKEENKEIDLILILRSIIDDRDIKRLAWKSGHKTHILKLTFKKSTCFIHGILPSMFKDDIKEHTENLINEISFNWLMGEEDVNVNLLEYTVTKNLNFCDKETIKYFTVNGNRIIWKPFIAASKILKEAKLKRVFNRDSKNYITYFRDTFKNPLELFLDAFNINNAITDFPYVKTGFSALRNTLKHEDDIEVFTFGYMVKINEVIKEFLPAQPIISKTHKLKKLKTKHIKQHVFRTNSGSANLGNISSAFDGIEIK